MCGIYEMDVISRVHADGTEKAENHYEEKRSIKIIYIFCVSTCDDNNVFRFFRFPFLPLYII